MAASPQNLVSLDSLAATLHLSRPWLRAEADAGRIPFLEVGRRRLFNVEAVRRVLAQQASGPDLLLTPDEVDSLLHWPPGEAVALAGSKTLPSIRLDTGEIAFRESSLTRWRALQVFEAGFRYAGASR